jgi:hypothetical protein
MAEEDYGSDHVPAAITERRELNRRLEAKVDRLILLFEDPDIGLRPAIKTLKTDVYGNGCLGIKTRLRLVQWALGATIIMFGANSPKAEKVLKMAVKLLVP